MQTLLSVIYVFIALSVIAACVFWVIVILTAKKFFEYRSLANEYRTPTVSAPVGPTWTITYRVGKKQESAVITGAKTEQEALKIALQSNIPFTKIVSLVKN